MEKTEIRIALYIQIIECVSVKFMVLDNSSFTVQIDSTQRASSREHFKIKNPTCAAAFA